MVYITQLVFVKPGKESVFLKFESYVIPLMEAFNGRIIYRVRPEKNAFIDQEGETPYEIHFISFNSENDLDRFLKDDRRLEYIHLKDDSVKSMLLVKGEKM